MVEMMKRLKIILDLKNMKSIFKKDKNENPKWRKINQIVNEKTLLNELQIQFKLKQVLEIQIEQFSWEFLSKKFLEYEKIEDNISNCVI